MSAPSSNSPRHGRSPLQSRNTDPPALPRSPAKEAADVFGSHFFMPASFLSSFNPNSIHGPLTSMGISGLGSSLSAFPPTSRISFPYAQREPTTFPPAHIGPSLLSGFTNRSNTTHIPGFSRPDDANTTTETSSIANPSSTSESSSPPSPNTSEEPSSNPDTSSSNSSPTPSVSHNTDTFVLPEEPTQDDFLAFYNAGSLQKRPSNKQQWELRCPSCTEWIYSGIPTSRDPSRPDEFQHLHSHFGRSACKRDQRKREKELERQKKAQRVDEDVEMEDIEPRIPPPSITVVNACTGVFIEWPVTKGTLFETFPFHRIGDKHGSLSFLVEIRDRGATLVGFSKTCKQTGVDGGCCSACRKIPGEVAMLLRLANDAQPQTNFFYLTDMQKTDLLRKRTEEVRQFRVKALNVSRKLSTALRKISDYKRFVNAVAEQDIPRLRNLVNVGLNHGASVSQIIRTMQMAVDGVYRPRPTICQQTLDMALLIFRLGGRKLLYAVNQTLDIPSLRTLRNNMQFTRVMPTVGWINGDDIEHNIAEVILKPLAAASKSQPRRGVSLQIDEVAIEERVAHSCYGLLGFCWCHSMSAKLRLDTFQDALDLSKMVKDGDVHMGSEMTVVAAGCFGGRPVFPILALPTCKSTGPEESKTIYQTVIEVWNRCARNLVGPVWSFATDGDAKRRKAGFDEFCKTKLPVTSPLYSTLAGMVGMNLYTGLFDVTLDSDYKHIFKRVCTQLRSRRGIVLRNGRIINADVLKRFLLRLPGQTEASVQRLLYPDDPQDVPRSVELMEKIVDIGGAGFEASDPEVLADLDSVALLGEVLKNLLTPFTEPSMSLTEQMTRLSTFAHLSFSIFRTRRTDFFSNQLYIDSQTMVKNAFFCLAKQQQLDREQPFYLFQTGDDRLERLFGKLRMLGGHNSAMSYQQAIERLGHACDLQGLYLRNPELEQTAVRLNMTRSEHVDHLNMDSWTGDVISGLCHAPRAWSDGSKRAAGIFERLRFDKATYDYRVIFAEPGVDMMRPLGDGKYPGVDEIDAEDPSAIPAASTAAATASTETEMGATDASRPAEQPADDEDNEGYTFDERLPEFPELMLPQDRPGFNPNAYLDVGNGKMVHMQRICRLLFNRHYDPKSLDRLKRVCGFKKLNSHRHDLDPNDLHGIDTFLIGDLFLTLLRVEQTVSLAVVRCTAIHDGSTILKSTFGATLRDPKSKIKITGQVLTMELIPTLSESDTVLPDPLPAINADKRPADWTKDTESSFSWIWTGSYLVVDSAMAGTSKLTDKVVTVSVPGILVEPIDPDTVDAVPRIGTERALKINSEGKTWEMRDGAMGAGCELLWATMVERKMLPKDLPNIKTNGGFPYAFSDGTYALLSQPATDQLVLHLEDKNNRTCHLCGDKKISNWRAHIGTHLYRFQRGMADDLLMELVDGHACGFCGKCGAPECAVSLKKTQTSFNVVSNCARYIDFKYGSVESMSCRNLPVICTICHPSDPKRNHTVPAHWRYNMRRHLMEEHPEYASPDNPDGLHPLPHALWESIRIQEAEEEKLGIPPALRSVPFTNIESPAQEGANGTKKKKGGTKRKAAPAGLAESSQAAKRTNTSVD